VAGRRIQKRFVLLFVFIIFIVQVGLGACAGGSGIDI
jgi:hypothetical protein